MNRKVVWAVTRGVSTIRLKLLSLGKFGRETLTITIPGLFAGSTLGDP